MSDKMGRRVLPFPVLHQVGEGGLDGQGLGQQAGVGPDGAQRGGAQRDGAGQGEEGGLGVLLEYSPIVIAVMRAPSCQVEVLERGPELLVGRVACLELSVVAKLRWVKLIDSGPDGEVCVPVGSEVYALGDMGALEVSYRFLCDGVVQECWGPLAVGRLKALSDRLWGWWYPVVGLFEG